MAEVLMPINVAPLSKYIEANGCKPFRWGGLDCCLFVADWIVEATGKDPASAWRGKYGSLKDAYRMAAARGGLVAAISAEMDAMGFARTNHPMPGDVGIVMVPHGIRDGKLLQKAVGAIRTGNVWSVKSIKGVGGADFLCVAAWEIAIRDA